MRRTASSRADLPVVGDWVLVEATADTSQVVVHGVLARRSKLSRLSAGGRGEQVVAANLDWVWLVQGLDQPLNVRRIERYLALAWTSGAKPAVLLTKADLCPEVDEVMSAARAVATTAPVFAVSSATGEGFDALRDRHEPGQTVALIGPSGAGKSTLVNRLAGCEMMRTGAVRDGDAKGRHTTTHRQLVRLPSGVLLVDTPGMRELGLWEAASGLEDAFEDVAQLASSCRFSDCRHHREPGCAVRTAVTRGELDADRLEAYLKLMEEHMSGLGGRAQPRPAQRMKQRSARPQPRTKR